MVLYQQQWVALTLFIMPLEQKLWAHGEIQLQLPLVFFGHKRTNFSLICFIERQISRQMGFLIKKSFRGGKIFPMPLMKHISLISTYIVIACRHIIRCTKKRGGQLFIFP